MSAAELPSTVGGEDNNGLLAYEGKPTKQSSPDEFVLEHVIGLTDVSAQALACNQLTGFVAFPAACILVLLDPKTNEQRFMESPTSKNISCVTFSDDGRLVAFGESGVKPYISVWQVKEHKPLNKFVVDHSCGLKELIFGPQSRFLVSLGSHDFKINVWNFAKGERLASASWQTAPLAMTIPKDSNVLVVCGRRKIMLISIEGVHSNDYETNVMMDKKAVLLGPQSEYTFVAVVPGKGRYQNQVYAITACGYLCEITLRDMLIGKAAKIDTFAQCLVFGIDYLFIGCAQGIVKICDPASLSVAATVSLHQLLGSRVGPNVGLAKVGDVSAIAIDERNSIVTCIYTDCSIYSWQVKAHNDVLECSILLPGPESSKDGQSNESSLYEQKQRVSLLRTFLGNSDQMRTHMMSDPNSLSSRSRHHGFHGIQQPFTQRKPLCQHVNSIRISPDGSEIIAGNDVGEIKVYDVTSGALRRVIEAHNSQVTFIELMYDDDYRLVCTGGRDRIIFVLNSKSDFSLVQVLCEHSAAITAISLVHNENQLSLVSAAADGLILIRHAQLAQGTIKFTLTGQVADTRSSQLFANSNSYLAVGAKSGNIELFRTDAFFPSKVHRTIKCHTSATHPAVFKSIDIDPSGSFLVAGRGSGQTTVYHLQTGQPVASLTSQCGVTAVKFTSDLKFIVSSSSTGCALIWRLPERMTEMMKSKQQKVEVAKEISYDAYVSCVRVCQELTECEDGEEQRSPEERGTHAQSGPNSNMNSEWAATPSIESLNLLECTSGCEPSCSAPSEDVHDDDDHDGCSSKGTGDVFDQCSLCSNNSFLSCSTCTGTLSGVETNEASSTDTSAAINTLSIPATSPIWGVAGEEKGKQREEKKENEDEKETETTESSSTPATSNAQLHNPPENEQQQQKEQEQEQEMEHLRQKNITVGRLLQDMHLRANPRRYRRAV